METPLTGIMATDNPPRIRPPTEGTRDVLDVLDSSVVQTAARQPKPEPLLQAPAVSAVPNRELLTEKVLADRWVYSVAPSAVAHRRRRAAALEDRGEGPLPAQGH